MSLYHIAFFVMIIGVVTEFLKKKIASKIYYVSFFLLAVMLCFRYGQGTDYFGYVYIYGAFGEAGISALWDPNLHGEIGWQLILLLFSGLKVPFTVFVFLHAAVEMLMLWFFIKRYCKLQNLALLLSYHTLYLTYYFSALRQGLVIALFLGLLLHWLLNKKYVPYLIVSVICVTIHNCAVLFLIAPIMHWSLFKTIKNQVIFVVAAWAAGFLLATGILDAVLEVILPDRVMGYFSNRSISVATLERVVTYAVVVIAYWLHSRKKLEQPPYVDFLMRMVTLGMIVYGGLLWMPLVASRLAILLKIVEIALLCSLLTTDKIWRSLLTLFCVALASFMYVKNIASYIDQGKYYNHITVLNYPYVSVLDREAILDYREHPYPYIGLP